MEVSSEVGDDRRDLLDQAEVSRHLEFIKEALDAPDATARDGVLGNALVTFGLRFLHSVAYLADHAKETGTEDPRWSEMYDAATDQFGKWLGGEQMTERVDEGERRVLVAYQLLDQMDGRALPARLVAKVIVDLPEGHPLRDLARARALIEAYLALSENETDTDTVLMTLGLLGGDLCEDEELAGIEARAAPLLDHVDPDAAVGYHVALAGRLAEASLACRDDGDEQGRQAWLARAQPHIDALLRLGRPRALAVAAVAMDAADEYARAAELYDAVRLHPEASPDLARLAASNSGRVHLAAGDAAKAAEVLDTVVDDLTRHYMEVISADDVESAGDSLARTVEHLTLALADLGRWDSLVPTLDRPKSARFRARQALRVTEAGRALLELERLILEVQRGVPADLPPTEDDPADWLRSGVPTLTTLQEAYRVDRPRLDPARVGSPDADAIAGVLASDEVAIVLGLTYEGTVLVAIDRRSGGHLRASTVDRSLTTRDWFELMAGENEDGWLYAIGAPEAPIDRPAALARLLDEVDARFAKPVVALLGGLPSRLCIVPHQLLHLVPWHALASFQGAVVTTAPSASQLVNARRQPVATLGNTVLVVADPTLDLSLSACEAGSARSFAATLGRPFEKLEGRAATEEAVGAAVRRAGLVHVSGHGQSDVSQPDNSALLLAPTATLAANPFPAWLASADEWVDVDEEERQAKVPGVGTLHEKQLLSGEWIERTMDLPGRSTIWSHELHGKVRAVAERWSAADLFVDDAFGGCALTVLSACESALGSLNVGIDEQSGLPAALALAGASTVIATEWPVDEGVAAVSVELLYDELARARGDTDLAALVDRIRERLRTMGRDDAAALVDELRQRLSTPRPRLLLEAMARRLRRGDPQPFARAWDWAAFVVVGKGVVRIEDQI